MGITVVPSAITGQTLSAADWNTQIRDNINGMWVLTTAGDMLYATGASAAARLALVPGGILCGGASAPAWLPKPTVNSFLKNTGAGALSWLDMTAIPGLIHTNGSNYTNSNTTSTSTSYVSIGAGIGFYLTLNMQCTIIAWAHGVGYKNSGDYDGYFALSINGVVDPNDNVRVHAAANTPFSCMYIATGVIGGSRPIELKYKTANASDGVGLRSAIVHAVAIVE